MKGRTVITLMNIAIAMLISLIAGVGVIAIIAAASPRRVKRPEHNLRWGDVGDDWKAKK